MAKGKAPPAPQLDGLPPPGDREQHPWEKDPATNTAWKKPGLAARLKQLKDAAKAGKKNQIRCSKNVSLIFEFGDRVGDH